MRSSALVTVTPQSDGTEENITTVNSKKHFESNESPISEKQKDLEKDEKTQELKTYKYGWFEFKTKVKWPNVIGLGLMYVGTVYTLLTFNIFQYKMLTLWALITGAISQFGVTGGAHRLWTHRSYKAKLPLRIILLVSFILAGENSVSKWVRDHRIHHKYSETDADPHNSKRGFFFCHVGWQMMKKHPEVLRRGNEVDMSDMLADPVLQFGERYFSILKLFICFVIPIIIPVYCWNEEWYMTIMSQIFIRYYVCLNIVWTVNSFAHFWGYKSYDKYIRPADNPMIAFVTLGEGWHNYHHSFPWDYKTSEFGTYGLNLTTMMIDGFAKIGWAYDLKEASSGLVRKVAENRGDGSHLLRGARTNNKQFIVTGKSNSESFLGVNARSDSSSALKATANIGVAS